MKIILAFCINLLIFELAYAEISRKDLVSYTLDFYVNEEKPLSKKAIPKEEVTSLPEYFSETNSLKPVQTKENQKKAKKEALVRKKAIKKALKEKSKKINKATLPPKPSGTKLSFSKLTGEAGEKEVASSKVDLEEKIKKEQSAEIAAEKPSYIKGILKNTHPYIMDISEFNDNIYHMKGDSTYDYVTKLYPGFEIKSKTSKKNFDAYFNAGAEILSYVKTPKNNTQSPFASGFAKYGFGRFGFITSASGRRFRNTPSDLADEEMKEFIDYWVYNMSQDMKINFNRLDIDLQYNKALYGYEGEEFNSSNHSRDVIALRNSVKIFPKTKAFLEYAHGWMNYDKESSQNFDYDRTVVGVKGKIFTKLDGTVKLGYTQNRRKTEKDMNGSIFNATLTYKASPRLYYYLNAVRGLGNIDLISEGISKYRGVSMGVSYLPPFLKKMRINSKLSYWQNNSDEQQSNYWNISFRPEYKLKEWFIFGLGYVFENRSSKLQASDYRNNKIEMRIISEF